MPKVNKKHWYLILAITLGILLYTTGFLTGWVIPKNGQMGEFPQIDDKTRLLVVAPHPDDESLMAGGLIQRVLEDGGKVKVIFLTSGDGSRSTVLKEAKKADLAPQEFLDIGHQRMVEAGRALASLGQVDKVFLGFPDQGLEKILHGGNTSPTTKFDHVPYIEAFIPGQKYSEQNLIDDIATIAAQFQPTIVITTHLRDSHPDHKAAFEVVEEVRKNSNAKWGLYGVVVHYKNYPMKSDFLFPPKKLFGYDWVSLELTDRERSKKTEVLRNYASQLSDPIEKNLFTRLSARNEIFEQE